ncbi:PEPxxWA-CTERM sorting domain-containing protein [Sphingobium lignivorans]|uniref:TSP C-terminal domain-containing protein n=1 Tax=Sphingobium lignivorans TaxID=2735886 RepID=A0ABR6NEP4_9SPHN|nr:PEPxxWA-CTERM sorting domain-containing protein [Sphingobium lignivorans]MBB5985750.1 hypothetical protein [Sphingobium lignivorans]
MTRTMKRVRSGVMALTIPTLTMIAAPPALAAEVPVDLSTWTAEGYGNSYNWVLENGNDTVRQTVNGSPTVFYSDFNAFGNQLSGTIRVNTTSDDDFVGFVIGFNPGDLAADSTDFLLIDWKQLNQNFYGFAPAGLAISHVTGGLADNAGAWSHDPALGVTELARGATLGSTGWGDNVTYNFDIAFTASNIKVWVDDVLQFDLDGTFSDGRFGFYNYSQAQVIYAGITNEVLPPPPAVPEPATWGMMIGGLALVGSVLRRQRGYRVHFA